MSFAEPGETCVLGEVVGWSFFGNSFRFSVTPTPTLLLPYFF